MANCGPHFLLPSLIHLVLGTPDEDVASLIKQLPAENHEITMKLEDLLNCQDPKQWSEAILNFDECFDMGINSATIPFEKKDIVLKAAVKHIMLSSVAEEIYCFQAGLSLFNVLGRMSKVHCASIQGTCSCESYRTGCPKAFHTSIFY